MIVGRVERVLGECPDLLAPPCQAGGRICRPRCDLRTCQSAGRTCRTRCDVGSCQSGGRGRARSCHTAGRSRCDAKRRGPKNRDLRTCRRLGNAILGAVSGGGGGPFACPACRDLLETPTTAECGHTLCAKCLGRLCGVCGAEVVVAGVNVLLRDLVGRRRAVAGRGVADLSVSETALLLGVQPRYHLRSRYAGLLPSDDNNTAQILSRLLTRRRPRAALADLFRRVDYNCDRTLREMFADVTESDLECVLCGRCFLDPITTSCGHTFCRGCLTRALDYSPSCPLCVAPLRYSERARGTTRAVEDAIRLLHPTALDERLEEETTTMDGKVPVFVCTNAFPGVACPLFVHEPRYRLLTRRCLESGGRRFAMAARADKGERFASYGTLLEVRDAVVLEDGRFILSTVGVRRFRVREKGEEDGYDTASILYFCDNPIPSEKLTDLIILHQKVHYKASKWIKSLNPKVLVEVERLIGRMPRLEKNWTSLPDGPAWTWWLIPIFPLSPQLQVGFLRTTSLEKRLRAIDKMVEHMKVRMKALERQTLSCADSVDTNETCSSVQG